MGWLELLPLLRKLLPLLSRVVPMLEGGMAARSATRAEATAALSNASESVRMDLQQLGSNHADLLQALAAQKEDLLALSAELTQLRGTNEAAADRLGTTEQKLTALVPWIKAAAILSGLVLLAILILVVIAVFTGRTPA